MKECELFINMKKARCYASKMHKQNTRHLGYDALKYFTSLASFGWVAG